MIKHLKEKKGTPTVIEYNGLRYVLDLGSPNKQKRDSSPKKKEQVK